MATTGVGSIEHSEKVRDKDSVVIQETWTIPTFEQLVHDNAIIEINSPTFTETLFTNYKFQLRVQFHRKNTSVLFQGFQSYNEINIFYKSSTQVFLESIRLSATEDRLMVPSDTMIWPCSIVDANKWRAFIRLATTTKMNLGQQFGVPVQSLRLQFEFVVSIKRLIEVSIKRLIEKNQSQFPATQLSNDFENLLHAGMYTDIVMRSAENEEFRVHKAVLASRSAVLKAHFEHNTTETITNIVESPIESEVLREVLFFIYTDKAPKVDENPEKLLAAADYYQLSRLKSICEEVLYKKLTVENAIETLQLADLHSATQLKQQSLELIKKDLEKSKLITKTEGWAKLQSVDLLKQICE